MPGAILETSPGTREVERRRTVTGEFEALNRGRWRRQPLGVFGR